MNQIFKIAEVNGSVIRLRAQSGCFYAEMHSEKSGYNSYGFLAFDAAEAKYKELVESEKAAC